MESKAKNSEKSSGVLEAWTPEKRYERPLSEGGVPFSIESDYMPAGDQPRAISELIAGLKSGDRQEQGLPSRAGLACGLFCFAWSKFFWHFSWLRFLSVVA